MHLLMTAPCLLGLEGLVADELRFMEAENVLAENGRVFFEGDEAMLARANINSRFAERILIVLDRFKAETFEELFQAVKALPWSEFIGSSDTFPVKGYSINSTLHSVPDCQKIIKKAVVESLKEDYGISWFEETGPVHQIQFSIMKNEVTIMLDSTGRGLHKRGYRPEANDAPIRETLAAALCSLSRLRHYHTMYDPCCGSGGMFVQSAKFVENHSGNINDISIYGQDSNPTTWKLAQMNLAIRGIEPDLGKYAADTFLDDQHPTMRADYIMANPPFNLSNWGAEQLKDDVRWQYGMPPASNANFAWLQHMIYHLAPGGRMGMVLANGSLSSQSSGEGDIRKNIVNADLVDCIIAMPTQLFYTTQIPVSLWFISKRKKQAGKTLFIDARKMGVMVSRKLRELADEDIKKIADTYNAYVSGTLEDVKGFCAVVDTEKIAEQDYILTPGRYVGVEEQEDDGESFEEKMARLTSELSDLFKQSHKLEAEIKEKLGAIGYEI